MLAYLVHPLSLHPASCWGQRPTLLSSKCKDEEGQSPRVLKSKGKGEEGLIPLLSLLRKKTNEESIPLVVSCRKVRTRMGEPPSLRRIGRGVRGTVSGRISAVGGTAVGEARREGTTYGTLLLVINKGGGGSW